MGLQSRSFAVVFTFWLAGLVGSTSAMAESSQATSVAALSQHFVDAALVSPPRIVDCTLSHGTQTKCMSLSVRTGPVGMAMGPWCPRSISDGADKGGIWLKDGKVFDVDGAFIKNASTFFKDDKWQLYDPKTGRVRVTDTEAACRAAARPDVDPKYINHCVECQPSIVDASMTMTYVIPLKPVRVARPGGRVGREGVGLSFNGARLDAPAPVDAILDAHTLAPFDDCGGHVNPHVGYHIHAVTDCLQTVSAGADHPPTIGIALDGFAIFARIGADKVAPADLDGCGGHEDAVRGYHYHAGAPGSNAILGCHAAETGCVLDDAKAVCDARTWAGWFRRWIE